MRREREAANRLPTEPIHRLTRPLARFLRIEAASGVVLLLFTVATLALANSPWSGAYLSFWESPVGLRMGALELVRPLRGWVSDARLHAILGRINAYPPGDHWRGDADRQALRMAELAARETLSPVERLEIALHPWVGFALLPLFALANAGVPIVLADLGHPVSLAVLLGFVLGKPLGIIAFSWLAVRTGLARRPAEITWSLLLAGSLLTDIGFTMALLIADLAFQSSLLAAAKLGILAASILAAVSGMLLLAALTGGSRQA